MSKIVLNKGETVHIPTSNLLATLSWTASVDLDIYAFYRAKRNIKPRRGLFGIGGVEPGQEGKIYFIDNGSLKRFPWIHLDRDAGVGDVGGQNKETIHIASLDELEHVLIAINIFDKPHTNFASYDGKVTLKVGEDLIEVPLVATDNCRWCVVAHIDNSDLAGARLINVNKVQCHQPTISQFVQR